MANPSKASEVREYIDRGTGRHVYAYVEDETTVVILRGIMEERWDRDSFMATHDLISTGEEGQ